MWIHRVSFNGDVNVRIHDIQELLSGVVFVYLENIKNSEQNPFNEGRCFLMFASKSGSETKTFASQAPNTCRYYFRQYAITWVFTLTNCNYLPPFHLRISAFSVNQPRYLERILVTTNYIFYFNHTEEHIYICCNNFYAFIYTLLPDCIFDKIMYFTFYNIY